MYISRFKRAPLNIGMPARVICGVFLLQNCGSDAAHGCGSDNAKPKTQRSKQNEAREENLKEFT